MNLCFKNKTNEDDNPTTLAGLDTMGKNALIYYILLWICCLAGLLSLRPMTK